MTEKKLTPAESFEHLKAVFPWLKRIEQSNKHEGGLFFRDSDLDVGIHCTRANIEWGETTSYKPEKWRPATIEDVKRALDGDKVECRVVGIGGRFIAGYISSLKPSIYISAGSTICDFFMDTVEVRE